MPDRPTASLPIGEPLPIGELLPIGDEPRDTSIRWARVDARRRGLSLDDALCARAHAFHRLPELRVLWTSTILEIHDGERLRPAAEVAATTDGPLLVLTAQNPLAIELGPEENRTRNAMLEAELEDPMPAVGRSPNGDWEEHGFAVPLTASGIQAAMSWGQLAVFRVHRGTVGVIELVGVSPDALGRLS